MSSSFDLISLILIIVTALVAILKIRKAHEGSKVKRILLIGTPSFFQYLYLYFKLIPYWRSSLISLFIIIFTSAEFLTYHYVKISFCRGSDGSIYLKGGLYFQIVFITSLVLRISVSIIFLGSASFYRQIVEYAQLVNDTPIILIAILATNISLIISGGIVLGLNRRLLRQYNLFKKGIKPTK